MNINKKVQRFLGSFLVLGLFSFPSISSAATAIQGADGTTYYYTTFAYGGGDGYSVLCILPYDHADTANCTNDADVDGKNYFNINVANTNIRAIRANICSDAATSTCPLKEDEVLDSCNVGDVFYLGKSVVSGPQLKMTIMNCNVSQHSFSLKGVENRLLDIDGNGEITPLTDGLLILRYLFGFTGDSLISNAIGDGASRQSAEEIKAYLDSK